MQHEYVAGCVLAAQDRVSQLAASISRINDEQDQVGPCNAAAAVAIDEAVDAMRACLERVLGKRKQKLYADLQASTAARLGLLATQCAEQQAALDAWADLVGHGSLILAAAERQQQEGQPSLAGAGAGADAVDVVDVVDADDGACTNIGLDPDLDLAAATAHVSRLHARLLSGSSPQAHATAEGLRPATTARIPCNLPSHAELTDLEATLTTRFLAGYGRIDIAAPVLKGYSTPRPTYTANAGPIVPNRPEWTGEGVSFAMDVGTTAATTGDTAALCFQGLAINPETGVISGAPTATRAVWHGDGRGPGAGDGDGAATHSVPCTVTARNARGISTCTLQLTVTVPAEKPCVPPTFAITAARNDGVLKTWSLAHQERAVEFCPHQLNAGAGSHASTGASSSSTDGGNAGGSSDDEGFTCVVLSPSERWLYTVHQGHGLECWDVSGVLVWRQADAHAKLAMAVATSCDGSRVVSGASDGTIRMWYAATGAAMRDVGRGGTDGHGHGSWINAVSWHGRLIHTASNDHTVKQWAADDITDGGGIPIHTFEAEDTGPFYSVLVAEDGTRIYAGAADNNVWCWDTLSATMLQVFVGHTGTVCCLALAHDGLRLHTGSQDRTVKTWDTPSGALLHTFVGHTDYVNAVAVSSDGVQLFSASNDGTVRCWDAAATTRLEAATQQQQRGADTAEQLSSITLPSLPGCSSVGTELATVATGHTGNLCCLVLGHTDRVSDTGATAITANGCNAVVLDRSNGKRLGVQLCKGTGGRGARVKSVDKGSQAEHFASIQPGRAITHINNQDVRELDMKAIGKIITSQDSTELVFADET